MSRSLITLAALSIAVATTFISLQAQAVHRTHVATYGLDSNTSFGCSVANPCRFFQAATAVVDPNGEVVVLDSGGYGAVALTKSISLIAPTGVYAGISVFPGSAGVMDRLAQNAKKHGLILRLVGNRIAFSPPLIITEVEVGEMVRRLESALDDTWQAVRAN